jgi:hypothetical protein
MRKAAFLASRPSGDGLEGLGIAPFRHHLAAMKRPKHVKAPAYLSKSPPVPRAGAVEQGPPVGEDERLDPTRYGDWENKGVAIDF